MKTIGERIKELREEKGINQLELSKILNVHKGSVSNWENNKRTPDADMLTKIADFFNCSIDYLLDRSEIKTIDNKTKEELNNTEEFDEDIRAIARNMKNLSMEKRKLLNDLIKTMSGKADEELKK